MDKNLLCYICHCSLPTQSPPSFTCNHTQCTSCLANYLLQSEFKTVSMSETLFLCPCDKGKLSLLPAQMKELFVSSLKEVNLCKKHKIAPKCYCLDCKLWICSECKKTFHDDLFAGHKTSQNEPGKDKECKLHQNEKIVKYCNECRKELCEQCEKEDDKHKSNIVDIKEKENAMKKEIQNKMLYKKYEDVEKIIEQKEKIYKTEIEKSNNCIKEKAKKIIDEITKQIKDLDSKKQNEIDYLDALFSSIKFVYKNMYSSLNDDNASINDLEELDKIEKHISEISLLPSETKEMDNTLSSLFKLLPSSLLKINISFAKEDQSKEEEQPKEIKAEIAVESPAIENNKETHTNNAKEESPLLTLSQKIVQKLKAAKKKKIAKDKHITITTPHSEFLTSLVRVSDDTLASSGTDKKVNFYLLNSDTGSYEIEPKMTISELSSTVRAMLVLSNGLSLVTGNSDGTLKLWSVVSKESIGMFDNYHTGCVRKIIQLSEDLIASCSDDAHIKIWNVNHLELTDVLKGEETKIYDILLLDEGRLLSAGEDCAINVWSIDKKGILKTMKEHEKGVVCLCKLSDGRFVSGGKDKCIKIWDTKSLTCKKSINAHSDWVNVLAEVKKGMLVSGGRDNLVKVWSLETFECTRTVEWHCNTIISLIKEDDDKLISASCDNTINIWNL